MNTFTKDYILSIPKTINSNGCWIPFYIPKESGYVSVHIKNKEYLLHRVVMCLYNDINYYDPILVTRHSAGCNKACFNPEHISYGTQSDNIKDSVKDKTQKEIKKQNCPRCGGSYSTKRYTSGPSKGKTQRYCNFCRNNRRKKVKM